MPTKRAPKGTGTVFRSLSRGLWVARKPIGTRLAKGGKQVTRYLERTGRTQAEAIRRRDAALPPDPRTTTVAQWAETWYADLGVSPLSKDAYRASLDNHILPALGSVAVRSLTAYHVESAIRTWGARVSATSIGNVLACLRACLGAAVRAELVRANPVSAARKPKKDAPAIDPFPPADLDRIITAASAKRQTRAVVLLAATGMRVGELVALDVTDFDPKAETISITKGDRRAHGTGPPKSRLSVRTIRVPADALPALVAARGSRGKGALFLNRAGARQRQGAVRGPWVKLLAELGLRFRNLHQLRHSVAMMMVGQGVPVTEIAEYLGDTVETVVRTYLHPTKGDPAAAVERALAAVRFGGDKVASAPAKGSPAPEK